MISQIDRESYSIITPIYLSPTAKTRTKYRLHGTIVDIETEKSIDRQVNIYVNGRLEAAGEKGQFDFELTNQEVESDQITIKFANIDYEPLTQVLNFNNHRDIRLSVTLKALPQEIVAVTEAPKVDAAIGVGEVTDSLDYLLTTIIETRAAFDPFDFETPIPKMELIEGDTFKMGNVLKDKVNSNEQVHSVVVSSFYLGTYEVTFEEYDRFARAKKRTLTNDKGWGRGKQPAIGISWYQAIEYCNWLSSEHGYEPVYSIDKTVKDEFNLAESDTLKWLIIPNWTANGYRLPTEAEWEFAAREGGQNIRFGNGLNQANPELINFGGTSSPASVFEIAGLDRGKTLPVGSFSPNAKALYDLSGNVSEWCWDWLGDFPNTGLILKPLGRESGALKVIRGGAYDLPAIAARIQLDKGMLLNLLEE